MKFSVFNGIPYGPTGQRVDVWPVPNELFDPERGMKAVSQCREEAEMEDELGFDWISVWDHLYGATGKPDDATCLESVTMHTRVPAGSERRPSSAAMYSIRLFVVCASPPLSSFSRVPKARIAPHPPTPGFPEQAPSV